MDIDWEEVLAEIQDGSPMSELLALIKEISLLEFRLGTGESAP